MRKPFYVLVLLAAPFLLTACDTGYVAGPDEGLLSVQSPNGEGDQRIDVRCGGEDAVAHRAAAHLEGGQDGQTALALVLAIAQRRGEASEQCQVHVLVPLRGDVVRTGTYEIRVTDRNVLLYTRQRNGGTRSIRFAPLSGRLRIDRVDDHGLAGLLAVRARTDHGNATATAHFRTTL